MLTFDLRCFPAVDKERTTLLPASSPKCFFFVCCHHHTRKEKMSSDVSPAEAVPPKTVIFVTYRTLMDAATIEKINYDGWKEVLDAFGYASLSPETCADELSLKSPHEVMTALCPFTTKAEWAPLLNKRDVRVEREVRALCAAEVLPIDGLKEFLIDCAKSSQCTVVLLSPFRETVMHLLLDTAQLSCFVDVVHSYSEQEFGILEACERLRMRPPRIPDSLRHIWEDMSSAEACSSGAAAEACSGAAAHQQQTNFLCIESDITGIRHAGMYGIPTIAVTQNLGSEEEDVVASPQQEARLLEAGARVTVPTYTSLRYEYLTYLW